MESICKKDRTGYAKKKKKKKATDPRSGRNKHKLLELVRGLVECYACAAGKAKRFLSLAPSG